MLSLLDDNLRIELIISKKRLSELFNDGFDVGWLKEERMRLRLGFWRRYKRVASGIWDGSEQKLESQTGESPDFLRKAETELVSEFGGHEEPFHVSLRVAFGTEVHKEVEKLLVVVREEPGEQEALLLDLLLRVLLEDFLLDFLEDFQKSLSREVWLSELEGELLDEFTLFKL